MEKKLKNIINKHKLDTKIELQWFLENNPENLNLNELSIIAEINNINRFDTAAYYTDIDTLNTLYNHLPTIKKEEIHVLEPSVGIGNFLDIIIRKYKNKKKVVIDVIDIDENSINILKILNEYREIPENIKIRYIVNDFLKQGISNRYDLVIGNPPFLKKNKVKDWKTLAQKYNDYISTNISSFFLQKCIELADNIVLIMPKYFLSNKDFENTRDLCSKYAIKKLIDFGEKGFKGVLIETIAIILDTNSTPQKSESISITNGIVNTQPQKKLTDEKFSCWLMYRNKFFDNIIQQMKMSVFKVVRDRAITNGVLNKYSGVRVIKSKNISRDGKNIKNIKDYDAYIDEESLSKLAINKFRFNTDVYLTPNMTYYPRVIKKPYDCVTNGSVAILINTTNFKIEQRHLDFWNSKTFTDFYAIARNYSTRSLNIDANSVQFFGLYEGGF
jgi:hypothetical protein